MRIWDLAPKKLCRQHLLAEHRELHAIWAILTENKKGYRSHPETARWQGRLKALYLRHEKLIKEFKRRGWQHHSPLAKKFAVGSARQSVMVDSLAKQRENLRAKKCACQV